MLELVHDLSNFLVGLLLILRHKVIERVGLSDVEIMPPPDGIGAGFMAAPSQWKRERV